MSLLPYKEKGAKDTPKNIDKGGTFTPKANKLEELGVDPNAYAPMPLYIPTPLSYPEKFEAITYLAEAYGLDPQDIGVVCKIGYPAGGDGLVFSLRGRGDLPDVALGLHIVEVGDGTIENAKEKRPIVTIQVAYETDGNIKRIVHPPIPALVDKKGRILPANKLEPGDEKQYSKLVIMEDSARFAFDHGD